MPTMHESPAEKLDTRIRRRPRTALKWIAGLTGLVIAAGATGVLLSRDKEGKPSVTHSQSDGTAEQGGGGGGEDTGMPDNIREIVDLPAFRQLAALALGAPENSISSDSERVLSTSDTSGNGSLSLFSPDGRLGLSLSYRPRTSQVGTKISDSLTAHQKTVSRNPNNYEPVAVAGAEAAFYNISDGAIDVFGSKTDNFVISVGLSKRNPGVPIGEGSHMGAGPDAMTATQGIAQVVVREYFGS